MADSYLFTLYIELRTDLSPLDVQALDYIFNDRADAPEKWPEHAYFQAHCPPPRKGGASGFPAGAYVSASWQTADHPGMFSGVNYSCPNTKLDWFLEGDFYMAQWLATLSSSRGYVGALKNLEDNEGLPWLFYVYDSRLYINVVDNTVTLLSVDSNEPYHWPPG